MLLHIHTHSYMYTYFHGILQKLKIACRLAHQLKNLFMLLLRVNNVAILFVKECVALAIFAIGMHMVVVYVHQFL